LKLKDAPRAAAVLERAVSLSPDWPDAHALLGRAYLALGKRHEAQREFDTARRLSAQERRGLEKKVSRPKPN